MELTENWIEQYKEKKSELKDYEQIIVDELKIILKDEPVVISSRIKDDESLSGKIIRNKYISSKRDKENIFEFLKDGIGVRIVCLEQRDEERIYTVLNEKHKNDEITSFSFDPKSIIEQPEYQKNGHHIFRINAQISDITFEIQIKSTTHMLWGEIEHLLFYKNYDCYIGSFYLKKQIEQIYNDLLSINARLSDLKDYMENPDDRRSDNEIVEISSKMLQTKLRNKQREYYKGVEVDYRDIYEAIINEYYSFNGELNRSRKKTRTSTQKRYKIENEDFSKLLSRINVIEVNIQELFELNIVIDEDELLHQKQKMVIDSIYMKLGMDPNHDEWKFFMNVSSYLLERTDAEIMLRLAKRLNRWFSISLENEEEYDLKPYEEEVYKALLKYFVEKADIRIVNEQILNRISSGIKDCFEIIINTDSKINSLLGKSEFTELIEEITFVLIELLLGAKIKEMIVIKLFEKLDLFEEVKVVINIRKIEYYGFEEFSFLLERCKHA